MGDTTPVLIWLRRDFRLDDHPALTAACEAGGPVIPVFLHDEAVDRLGAAAAWRLGEALACFARRLDGMGSRLILRRGPALETLLTLAEETGARRIFWSRAYDPAVQDRDRRVKAGLEERGIEARSHKGHLCVEPWTVTTQAGDDYKVYSPFWRAIAGTEPAPVAPVCALPSPDDWPASERLEDWALGAATDRGADVLARHCRPGEEAARARWDAFAGDALERYKDDRNLPATDGTSGLSEYLAWGEISARRLWVESARLEDEGMARGAGHFRKELAWREFAYHLLHHRPDLGACNWRREWDAFPWNEDADRPEVVAWQRGRTGVPFVDAGMREMYVTGRMHNRSRMIVASYLTKHLMTHWKIGLDWFAEHLTDWDPASNALGWQWTAGSGPDAAPYFRIFNPETQLDKFDPDRAYVRRWIAEGQDDPPEEALSYFEAVPRDWELSADDPYPDPVVGMSEGRKRALDAYENREF